MNVFRIIRLLGVSVMLAWMVPAVPAAAAPSSSAASCPDVELLFARGTGEDPPFGPTGQAFADALRSKIGGKSFNTYGIDYPASDDWPTGVDGVRDAATHIQSTASRCPNTRMVLSGYSQGAAVMGFTTANVIPEGVDGSTLPQPMPPDVANHVAAVVLFGKPNARAMNFLNQPLVVIGPLYAGKTIDLCAPEDAVCSDGLNFAAHTEDSYTGMVDEGADYAVARL